MAETDVSAAPFSGRTAWTRNLQTPLRAFLNTETGSAAVLLVAVVAALVWANIDHASYERVWTTTLSIRVGAHSISLDLRGWINSGLMAFFFFVIGLEARREFDLGELRERRRVASCSHFTRPGVTCLSCSRTAARPERSSRSRAS